jgi:galactokinase
VVQECERVRSFAEALESGDVAGAGALMRESHTSLADRFEVSTGPLDQLVDHLESMPGVLGARMTGAGFGGCVVALARPGAVDTAGLGGSAWSVTPVDGTVTARGYRG